MGVVCEIKTFVSADWYQHFIPILLYSIGRYQPGVSAHTYLCGEPDAITVKALDLLGRRHSVLSLGAMPFKLKPRRYLYNCLRFIAEFETTIPVLMVDVDFILFDRDLVPWHARRMRELKTCFAAHHGPYKRPLRPQIAPHGWHKEFERVSGGFAYFTPEWYQRTREARAQLATWPLLGEFRESDEVALCRILKASKLPVPLSKYFPPALRGIHLGDFRPDMKHRWTNMAKMTSKLTDDNCRQFLEMEKDQVWRSLCAVVEQDSAIRQILSNVRQHIRMRGIR
jgi:hypothetical protein